MHRVLVVAVATVVKVVAISIVVNNKKSRRVVPLPIVNTPRSVVIVEWLIGP